MLEESLRLGNKFKAYKISSNHFIKNNFFVNNDFKEVSNRTILNLNGFLVLLL